MGERYHGFSSEVIAANDTTLALVSAATVRPRLYELIVGSPATPADQFAKWVVRRFTAVGTEGNGFTPVPLDPDGPAAEADYSADYAGAGTPAEPTYTGSSELLVFGLNQRATFRWVAAPGGELIAPATANNGLGLCPVTSGGTAIHSSTMFHEE